MKVSPYALLLGIAGAFGVWVFIRSRQEGITPEEYVRRMLRGELGGR